jgi:hypothetical protein
VNDGDENEKAGAFSPLHRDRRRLVWRTLT